MKRIAAIWPFLALVSWLAVAQATPLLDHKVSFEPVEPVVSLKVSELKAMKDRNEELYADNQQMWLNNAKLAKDIAALRQNAATHCDDIKSAAL